MIHIVGARCDRCAIPLRIEGPRATGDAYIERQNGDRLVTLCKNARLCAENQRDRPA